MTDYKIVVTLSHSDFAIHYTLPRALPQLLPLNGEDWPMPLAVYCSNDRLVVGADALGAVNAGSAGAYTNLFAELKSSKELKFGGKKILLKEAIMHAVESQLKRSDIDMKLASLGDDAITRGDVPLYINYAEDLTFAERDAITLLFRTKGYARLEVLDNSEFLKTYIARTDSRTNFVAVSGDGKDLYYNICNSAIGALKGEAVDPRVPVVINKIWESVTSRNPYLRRETEEATLKAEALKFILSDRQEQYGKMVLSDGATYEYMLSRTWLNNYHFERGAFARRIQEELNKLNINSAESVLVLEGSIVGNMYFRNALAPDFNSVIEVDDKVALELREIIFRKLEPESAPFRPEPTPKVEEVEAEPADAPTAAPAVSDDDDEHYTKVSITGTVNVKSSGFLGLKKEKTLHLSIDISDSKMPVRSVLLIQPRPLAVLDTRYAVSVFDRGESNTKELDMPLPLKAMPNGGKAYVYLVPHPDENLGLNSTYINCGLTIEL